MGIQLDPNNIEQIIANDCYFRAKNQGFTANYMVDLNQILVPKSGLSNLKHALNQTQKSGQLLIDVLKFCSEYPEDNKYSKKVDSRLITAFQQTVHNTDLSSGLRVKVSYKSGGEQHHISRDDIAVHDYGNCNNYDMDVNGAESFMIELFQDKLHKLKSLSGIFFHLELLSQQFE